MYDIIVAIGGCMDISRMRPVRISPFASARVMADHFPTVDEETGFKNLNVDSSDLTMSVVALSFAYILNTNYCNLLVSIIDFVEEWRQNIGQVPYVIGVYLFGVGLECLVCWAKLLFQRIAIKN